MSLLQFLRNLVQVCGANVALVGSALQKAISQAAQMRAEVRDHKAYDLQNAGGSSKILAGEAEAGRRLTWSHAATPLQCPYTRQLDPLLLHPPAV